MAKVPELLFSPTFSRQGGIQRAKHSHTPILSFYSDRRVLTGLLIAARKVFRLTTTSVINRMNSPTETKSQMLIVIRNS